MRKLLYAIFLISLTCLSSSVLGQNGNSEKTEQEIRTLICHKWYPDSLQMDEEKISAELAGIDKDFIYFHNNGTFSDASKYPTGYVPKNKWSYNHKARTITTDGGVKKILVINEQKLVLSGNSDGQKFKLIYKRAG